MSWLGFRPVLLTAAAMVAFAANSLLCRVALQRTDIDPARFTPVRLAAGATLRALLVGLRERAPERVGSWVSALALFVYVAAFSLAHASVLAGTAALDARRGVGRPVAQGCDRCSMSIQQ